MAAVTSASTDQAVWDAYDDNASYEEDESVSKAQAFITVCRVLLRRRPNQVSVDGTTTSFEAGAIQKALDDARKWLALNNTSDNGGSVRHLDFRYLRE
jgi:hypothetical protein